MAIVSLVPESARLTKIGLTVFNNDSASFDLGGRVDKNVQSIARGRIAKAKTQWTVREISYDGAALLGKLRSFGVPKAMAAERIQEDLTDLIASNHLDAILLIIPESADSFGIEGLGIWMRPGLISGIRFLFAHARIALEIIGPDGKALALASSSKASLKELDAVALGVGPNLQDDIKPELIDRFGEEILLLLGKTLNSEFDELGF